MTEGKNREIRRVLARLGHKVMVLRRLGIGPLRLANLAEGMYRPLTNEEVAALYAAAERARIARRDQKKGRNSTKADEPGKSGESKAAKVGSKGTRKPKKTKPDDEEILNDIEQSLMDVDDWNEDDDLVLPSMVSRALKRTSRTTSMRSWTMSQSSRYLLCGTNKRPTVSPKVASSNTMTKKPKRLD